MSVYVPNVRAIKGLAPTALDFNSLANNLEYANTLYRPRVCTLQLSGNSTITTSLTTALASLTFDTSLLDTASMFSGGVLTPPSNSKFIKISFNLKFSTTAVRDFAVYPATYSHELGNSGIVSLQQGWQMNGNSGAGWVGVGYINFETGWLQYNPSTTNYQILTFVATAGTSYTINSNEATWLQVEVL